MTAKSRGAPKGGETANPEGNEAAGAGCLRRHVPAGKFKAVCLSLMDRVKENGVVYIITKRGKPVAKLVPITDDVRPFVGRSRGVISASRGDLLAPIGENWDADADL